MEVLNKTPGGRGGRKGAPLQARHICLSLFGLPKQNAISLGGLNNRASVSDHSGGWRSKIRVPAGLGSSEGSLPGLQMAAFSVSLHGQRKRKQAI